MTSSNVQVWGKKYILLNNLQSKYSLVMKSGQFMSYYKRKSLLKKCAKKWGLHTSSRPICIYKELCTIAIQKWNPEANWLYQICNRKTIKICPRHPKLAPDHIFCGIFLQFFFFFNVIIIQNMSEITFKQAQVISFVRPKIAID